MVPSHLPQAVGTSQHLTYDNVQWLADDYTVTALESGGRVTYQLRVLAANYGTHTFIVVLQAPQDQFGGTDGARFEPLLRSFRFG